MIIAIAHNPVDALVLSPFRRLKSFCVRLLHMSCAFCCCSIDVSFNSFLWDSKGRGGGLERLRRFRQTQRTGRLQNGQVGG